MKSSGNRDEAAVDLKPPFAAGQARQWLDGFHGEHPLRGAAGILAAQACGHLDAKGAEELFAECRDLLQKMEEGDADLNRQFESDTLETLQEAALVRLAAAAPDQALALAKNPKSGISEDHLEEMFAVVAATDLNKAKQALASMPEEMRDKARQAVFEAWLKTDPVAMMAEIEAAPDSASNNSYLYCAGINALAERDPDAAVQHVLAQAGKGDHMEALSSLLSVKPELAKQFVDWAEHYQGPDAAKAQNMVLYRLVDDDLGTALQLYRMAAPNLEESDRQESISEITRAVADDAVAAREWVASQTAGPDLQFALLRLCSNIAGRALAPTLEERKDGPVAAAIADYKSKNRPTDQDIEGWVAQLDPPSLDDYTRMELLGALLETHSDAAMAWIARMPEGPERDKLQKAADLQKQMHQLQEKE